MKTKRFKINYLEIFKISSVTLLFIAIPQVVLIGDIKQIDKLLLSYIMLLPFYLPGIILIINYLQNDLSKEVIVSSDKIEIINKNNKVQILKNEILKIVIVENSNDKLPWASYQYILIFTNNHCYAITNFITSHIRVKGVKYKIKKVIFPYISPNKCSNYRIQ